MNIVIDDKNYEIEIVKKNNKNTYIRVKNGKIIVTTNYFTSRETILKLIKDNLSSISKMIDIDNKKQNKSENFYYFGKPYDIIYGLSDIEFTDTKIYAPNKKVLDKYLDNEIKRIYLDRLNYWYNIFEENIPKPNLKIRKMTTRWGVCNIKSHNITLNYMLMKYDKSCLDYVIVHELSHFIHHNHGKSFWLLVAKYYPKYKECKKMLKE